MVMKRVVLTAALASGMAASGLRGADGGAGPYTRPAPLPAPPLMTPAPRTGTEGNGATRINLLGKPEGLSPEQLKLGEDAGALLELGRQADSEQLLAGYVRDHPTDQKALLLEAAVIRSRPTPGDARELFERVAALDGNSAEGKAAKAMIADGEGRDQEAALRAFVALSAIDRSGSSETVDWLRLMTAGESGRLNQGEAMFTGGSLLDPFHEPVMCRRVFADLMETKDNFRGALVQRQDVVHMVPAGWSYRELALTEVYSRDGVEAEASARQAADLAPEEAAGWIVWAQVLGAEGKTAEAVEKLRRAGALAPKDAAVEIEWAEILSNAGNAREAIGHARRAVALDPHDRAAHTMLGRALDKAGQGDAAKEEFKIAVQPAKRVGAAPPALPQLMDRTRVVELNPGDACGQVMAYLAAGKQDEARKILDELALRYPRDQDLQFLDGVWLFPSIITDSDGKAKLSQAVAANPDSDKGKLAALMLKVFADHGDEVSFDAMCGIVEAHDQDPVFLWAGGVAAVNKDNVARGLEYFRKLSDFFVVGPEIYQYQYGRMLDSVADYQDGLGHLEMSVHLDPGGWNHVELGWALGKLRQFGDANAAFAKGLPYAGQFAYRWYDWAHVLKVGGHEEDAIEKYERAISLDPKNETYFMELREAMRALGKTDAARSAWLDAVAIYRSKGEAAYAKELQAEVPKSK